MKRALVGWSGFVGGVLRQQVLFDDVFRRTDVAQLASIEPDEVVCAGAPAEKWRANAEPEQDAANLSVLAAALVAAARTARHCTLISTVDVFGDPVGASEGRPPQPPEQAYGRHRLALEDVVTRAYASSTVVRLPALYGPGLKKNLVYDLLHQPDAVSVDARSTFQLWDVRDTWAHALAARDAALPLVHLVTEPVTAAHVAKALGRDLDVVGTPVHYDLRTAHAAELAARTGPYLRTADEVLAGLTAWAREERA